MGRRAGEFAVELFMARVFLIQAQAPPALSLLNLFDSARPID
jgi:hypothetical protein